MVQSKGINFEGQNIYIGIDVHLKNWSVSIITPSGYKQNYVQPASAQALFEYLRKNYPKGTYHAVYESGFSGFSTYYALEECGIKCMVIHAADVPTTQYESVMKTDAVDSMKLAKALMAGLLNGIYIHRKETLDDRSVVRLRKTVQRQIASYKSRIKHLLYNHGVVLPACFSEGNTHWSRRFINWLEKDVALLSPSRNSLDLLLRQLELLRKDLLSINRLTRSLSRTERYAEDYQRLVSIPGVGHHTSMCLLTEIDDLSRFRNEKQFASYLGLIPTSHSSGEKTVHGEKTFRGNNRKNSRLHFLRYSA